MTPRRRTLLAVGAAVVGAASLATAGTTLAGRGPAAVRAQAPAAAPALAPSAAVKALQDAYVAVVEQVSPSVVQIQTAEGLGSGVVYDTQGDVVTNAHVVGTAKTFRVTLSNGRQYTGRLVGVYAANDLAVIRIDAKGLRPLAFADTRGLLAGTIVLAIGNPLGFRSSVSEGIVSATGRVAQEPTGAALTGLVQTSAAINPGNSGGALVDMTGKVVGIPTLVPGSDTGGAANGIGFAISGSTVNEIAPQLIRFGKVVSTGRAYLGVEIQTLPSGGVLVGRVVAGGPASKAGIAAGDVILSLNGAPTPAFEDLSAVLSTLKPGQTVSVTVRHQDGKSGTLRLTLGQAPALSG